MKVGYLGCAWRSLVDDKASRHPSHSQAVEIGREEVGTNAMAMARKTPGIKGNTVQCYVDYSKITLMAKDADLNT